MCATSSVDKRFGAHHDSIIAPPPPHTHILLSKLFPDLMKGIYYIPFCQKIQVRNNPQKVLISVRSGAHFRGPDSLVCIATRYGLDDLGIESQW